MKNVRSHRNELRWEVNVMILLWAWALLKGVLLLLSSKYTRARQRRHIAWFRRHETLSQSKTKAITKQYQTAVLPLNNKEISYRDTMSNLKLFNRKRKCCLSKLSTKSQSQTHLRCFDRPSALNFHWKCPRRDPVSLLLKHHESH